MKTLKQNKTSWKVSLNEPSLAKQGVVGFKFLFCFSVFTNKFCSNFLVIELCASKVRQTDLYTGWPSKVWTNKS